MDLSVFDPPEDHLGLDLVFWPALCDQIELIDRRQQQIDRVLNHYTGRERDYEELSRESGILLAVLHTLTGVRKLTGNGLGIVRQSEGSNTNHL